MSDQETRAERANKIRTRNPVAKELLDRKGPFALRIVNPKKTKYRRVKLNPRDLPNFEEEE